MSYTTVDAVCGMFPTFTRNGPKGPSDALVETYIADVATEIDSILLRRFQEAIALAPANGSFAAWTAAFSAEQLNKLECINRFGACSELAIVFETAGISAAARVAKTFEDKYQREIYALDGRDEQGRDLRTGGPYDKLFNPNARSISVEPDFFGVAGGDQPRQKDQDVTNYFKKWPGTKAD
jgi:hypothetical protein